MVSLQKGKKWGVLMLPFFQILILLRLSPMMYDGWAGSVYYHNMGGLLNWVRFVFGGYRNQINGRVASNLFSGLLESFCSEWLLDIVGALIVTLILACLIILLRTEKPLGVTLVYCSLIALMPCDVRTYMMQMATVQFVTPVLFLMAALVCMRKYEDTEEGRWVWYLYPLSLIACCWMENSSFAYGVVLALCCFGNTIKTKKVDLKLWGSVAVGLCSGIYMLTAPGMHSSRDVSGESFLSFSLDRFDRHLLSINSSFIGKAALANVAVSLVFIAFSVWYWTKNKKSIIRLLLCAVDFVVLFCFINLGFASGEFIYTSGISNVGFLAGLQQRTAGIFGLLFVWLVWIAVHAVIASGFDRLFFELGVFAAVCILIVLPTNQIGVRIYSPCYFILVAMVCMVASKTNISKGSSKPLKALGTVALCVVVMLAADYQAQLCNRLKSVTSEREARIEIIKESQIDGTFSPDTYYALPAYLNRDAQYGGATKIGTFHYPQFLYRYGLSPQTKIVFVPYGQTMALEADISDMNNPTVHVANLYAGDFSYDFTVLYRRGTQDDYARVAHAAGVEQTSYSFEPVFGSGEYLIKAENRDASSATVYQSAEIAIQIDLG